MDLLKITFASQLKLKRGERKLTRKRLAMTVGLSEGGLSRLENEADPYMPSLSLLRELATILQVSIDSLLGFETSDEYAANTKEEVVLLSLFRSLSDSERVALLKLIGHQRMALKSLEFTEGNKLPPILYLA